LGLGWADVTVGGSVAATISTSTGTSMMVGVTVGGDGDGARIGSGMVLTGSGASGAVVNGGRLSQTPKVTDKATKAAAVIRRLSRSKRVMAR